MPSGSKYYAVVDLTTGLYSTVDFFYDYEPPASEPTPRDVEGAWQSVHLSDEVLAGMSREDFIAQKRPVISGVPPVVTQWIFKADDPAIELSENPYDDGSNVVTVSLVGGQPLANKGFQATFSRTASLNLPNGVGTFDSGGNATFKFKVIGQGALQLRIAPYGNNDFLDGFLDVTVLPAPLV